MRRGDIIVNPWVSREHNGLLNPLYATIYLGDNYSLDYKGRKHLWADKVYKAVKKLSRNENVSTEVLGKLSKALECSIDDIVDFSEEQEDI